jgi:hypothetical protein
MSVCPPRMLFSAESSFLASQAHLQYCRGVYEPQQSRDLATPLLSNFGHPGIGPPRDCAQEVRLPLSVQRPSTLPSSSALLPAMSESIAFPPGQDNGLSINPLPSHVSAPLAPQAVGHPGPFDLQAAATFSLPGYPTPVISGSFQSSSLLPLSSSTILPTQPQSNILPQPPMPPIDIQQIQQQMAFQQIALMQQQMAFQQMQQQMALQQMQPYSAPLFLQPLVQSYLPSAPSQHPPLHPPLYIQPHLAPIPPQLTSSTGQLEFEQLMDVYLEPAPACPLPPPPCPALTDSQELIETPAGSQPLVPPDHLLSAPPPIPANIQKRLKAKAAAGQAVDISPAGLQVMKEYSEQEVDVTNPATAEAYRQCIESFKCLVEQKELKEFEPYDLFHRDIIQKYALTYLTFRV